MHIVLKKSFLPMSVLAQEVAKIRTLLAHVSDKNVGLVANDDIYTYASIYALWLEGKAYVPLHPGQPLERCLDIIQQVGYDCGVRFKQKHSFITIFLW